MKSIKFTLYFFILLGLILGSSSVNAEKDKKESPTLNKTTGVPVRSFLNINNVSTVFKNTGISDIDRDEQNSGFVFPKGSGKAAVFQSGFLWGAKIANDPQVRVGGAAYREGLQGGRITNSGLPWEQLIAEAETAPNVRMYRVRPDVKPGGPAANFASELDDNEGTEEQIRAQYEADWTEWPAQFGAPYADMDSNGVYDPNVDVPGVPGADQTIWFVANDLNSGRTTNLYGALPLGIEMQATFWAYNRTGALGNMIFRKYTIINKSNTPFNDMYVSMWSDVDLGNSTDDFAGCDTSLSLGYCYNANAIDATYNPLPPPAVGFDFFQGPLINGTAGQDLNKNGIDDALDFGIFKGDSVGPGKINLPMTSFYYFARGDANLTDPTQGDPQGSTQFYNFFQGRIGKTGQFFLDPNTNQPTTFSLTGDPVTRTGWIDGQLLPSGDRRVGQGSGPFTMAPGDTQEVVVAEIAAGALPGVDRLSAIGLLKFYDRTAQDAFDNFFDLPTAPPAPVVNVPGDYDPVLNTYYALDRKIVLDWGENAQRVQETENFASKGYTFEGYNVYQLPNASASIDEARRIATYDVANGILKIEGQFFDIETGVVATKVQQFGNDTGLERVLTITTDALSGGTPLINGIRYYFAVTAYAYNPDATITNLENPLQVFTIIPTSKVPGMDYGAANADTVAGVVHSPIPAEGGSDGVLYPIVIDPTLLTGLKYTVTFDTIAGGTVVWNVDREDGVRVLANQTNQNANAESPIADGIQFRMSGAPLDFKGFDMISNGNGPVTETVGYDVTSAPTDVEAYSADWYRDVTAVGSILDLPNGMQAGGGWFFITAANATVDHVGAIERWSRGGANFPTLIPNNYEIRFTQRGGKAWMAFTTGTQVDVPFEIWYLGPTLGDASDDVRMMPWLNDDNANEAFDFHLDHEASSAANDPYCDWIYFMMPPENQPGEAGYEASVVRSSDPAYAGDLETEHLARVTLMNWNQHQSGGDSLAMPDVGTTFRIRMTVPNAPGVDRFEFTAPKPGYNVDLAKQDVKRINVFPNPYYGVNSEELNKYNRFVTFTHLPAKATIRIFNLAGVQVRSIEKNDLSTYQRWDLANNSGLPVASGLYIAYIDMPDLGETKVLKLAIIQEQQILDRF